MIPPSVLRSTPPGLAGAIDSIYQILTDLFFSHLSDLHGLHVLARGSLFSDEWRQFQNTLLARGLAAWLSFTTLQDDIGPQRLNEIQRHDWTVWNLRRIGTEFDDLNWENNFPAPHEARPLQGNAALGYHILVYPVRLLPYRPIRSRFSRPHVRSNARRDHPGTAPTEMKSRCSTP